jgi:hypothetical protein
MFGQDPLVPLVPLVPAPHRVHQVHRGGSQKDTPL